MTRTLSRGKFVLESSVQFPYMCYSQKTHKAIHAFVTAKPGDDKSTPLNFTEKYSWLFAQAASTIRFLAIASQVPYGRYTHSLIFARFQITYPGLIMQKMVAIRLYIGIVVYIKHFQDDQRLRRSMLVSHHVYCLKRNRRRCERCAGYVWSRNTNCLIFDLSTQLGREVLDIAASHVRPGITTDEIDEIVHNAVIERNAYPSPLNYRNFPKSICT
jgi:hypothetical protein